MPHRFLVIEQGESSTREVFEVLVGDVCRAVATRSPGTTLEGVVIDRLARWKSFFDEGRSVGLGPEAQQGLFGELWFLRDVLVGRVGLASAITSWTGAKRANHDFQFPGHAFEVKSSTAKQHVKVYIASERQLEASGPESLHLVVLGFNVLDAGGETLPHLVASLRSLFVEGEPGQRLFEDKLLEAGYIAAHEGHYTTGYAFRAERTYAVVPGFPRLLESDLPAGVGDLSYSVVLSACEPYRCKLAEALNAASTLGAGPGP